MIESIIMALLVANHTTQTIPFPVIDGGLTFCFNQYKKVDGERAKYIECNYVEMKKRKLEHVRDYLENWTMIK